MPPTDRNPFAPDSPPTPRLGFVDEESSSLTHDSWPARLLRWTCAVLFFARAWHHLRWDPPYRALLWSQDTMESGVRLILGMSWDAYASSPVVDHAIGAGVNGLGVLHLACGVAAVFCTPARRWTHVLLALGALALTFLAYVSYRDRLHQLGEFVEYASQFSLPVLLVLWIRGAFSSATLGHLMRAAIAFTFVGHGLYATGFYPTPGEWVTMTIEITGLGDTASLRVLHVAGLLDFAVAAAVFVPHLARPALAYAAAWGLLTALARTVAFVRWDAFGENSSQWLFETLVRLPHAVLPVVLFWLLRNHAAAPAFSPEAPLPVLSASETPRPTS